MAYARKERQSAEPTDRWMAAGERTRRSLYTGST